MFSRSLIRFAGAALALGFVSSAQGVTIFALTTQGVLVRFDSATPGTVITIGAISGTTGSASTWRGIDFRQSNGQLYLLQAGGGAGGVDQLYTVNTTNAAATLATNLGGNLTGNPLGMDFNPVVDLLRVVTTSNQNYRVSPSTGAITADTNVAIQPGGAAPFILGSAYTNGAILTGPPATTALYNIDIRNSSLTLQGNPSPNDGVNTQIGLLGPTFLNTEIGFDIYFSGQNFPFLAGIPTGGTLSSFYNVNLGTGAATLVGQIGGGVSIRDISAVPAPGASALLALGGLMFSRRRR